MRLILGYVLFMVLSFGCKKTKKEDATAFTLISSESYYNDGYNGVLVYRDKATKKPMDGYFVVGNEVDKWEEFNLKKGLLHGDYIVFHKNGNIFMHSKYLNGKLHGEEKKYGLSGALVSVCKFSNGIKYGKQISYFENGEVQTESVIKNGEIIESITYDIIGEVVSQIFINDGRKITQRVKNGKVFYEDISSTYDNFHAFKIFHDDGSLKLFIRMLEDGDSFFIVELDQDENELKRINVKENPDALMKYKSIMEGAAFE